jgi:hypothetical protein
MGGKERFYQMQSSLSYKSWTRCFSSEATIKGGANGANYFFSQLPHHFETKKKNSEAV